MALCPNPSGAMTINSQALETECSAVLSDFTPLWFVQRLIEADVQHIPGLAGDQVQAPEIGSVEHKLRWVIIGEKAPDGTPYADPWEGIYSNVNIFRSAFLDPIVTNNGLQTAVLDVPGGGTVTADVLVRPPEMGGVSYGATGTCADGIGDGKNVYMRLLLPILIPSGLFS